MPTNSVFHTLAEGVDLLGAFGKSAVVTAAAIAAWKYFSGPIRLAIEVVIVSHSMRKAFGPDAGRVIFDMIHAIRHDVETMRINGFLRDRYLGLGIYVCRPDGATTYVSQNLCEMFESTEEQMLGFAWVSRIEGGMALAARWRMCAENGLNWDERYWIKTHGGGFKEVATQAFPIHSKDGGVMSYVGMVRFTGKTKEE